MTERRERSVEYVTELWQKSDIPAPKRGGVTGGNRSSQLDKQIKDVMEAYPEGTPEDAGVLLGRYGNDGNGATSAKVTLSKRYPEAETGLKFYSRKLEDGVRGLFMEYDPSVSSGAEVA